MTFERRFVSAVLGLCLLPVLLWSVPLHPDTEAQLRQTDQFQAVRAALLDASSRGVNQPTTRPIDIRQMSNLDDRLELRVLTILVDFDDNPANLTQYPVEHYNELLYSVDTFPTGSVRDYYLENSYDNVHITGEVVGWYRMPESYAYYVDNNYGFGSYPNNSQRLTEDAVAAANPEVDFSQYDNDNDGYVDALFVVHAGPGAEQTGSTANIWSHAWVTHNMPYVDGVHVYSYSQEPDNGNIGVFVHELGHALFGLPDLYDYGYDSNGTGSWSVMSGGVWANGGVTPVHLDAWSKIEAGFVEAVNVVSDETDVSIPEVETNDVIYKLWTLGSQGSQYFLVENRQQTGFDQYLPGSGLMIYHIEGSAGNNSNQWYPGYTSNGHYLVAVEQADGDWDLEQNRSSDNADPWPGSSNSRTFNAASTPDSKDYNAQETDVVIENISDSGPVMTADFQIGIFFATGQEIVLTPDLGSLSVPANGGTVDYNAAINNYEPASYSTQFWINVILPSGDTYGPLLGPVDLTVSAMSFIDGDLAQMVPNRAPDGNYTMVAYMGIYGTTVDDSSFFIFNKSATTWVNAPTSNLDGWEVVGGFDTAEIVNVPQAFYLSGAFPNPFNPTTTISFTLPEAGKVSLKVFDIGGRLVATLIDGFRSAGQHEVTFDAADLSSGVYLYQLKGGAQTFIGKMILTK